MIEFFNRLFKIPVYENSEANIVARMTLGAAIGMVPLGVAFVVVAGYFEPSLVKRAAYLTAVFTAASIGIVALIRSRHLQIASTLLVACMWLAVTIGSVTAGGVSAPIFVGYLVVILASGLIANNRISAGISIMCVLSGVAILIAETNGLLPEPLTYNPRARFGIYTFFFVLTILLQNVNKQNLQELLKQALDSEARYKILLENIPTVTYINSTDEEARTEYVSPQVEILLGYPREAFQNDPVFWLKIVHPDDHQRVTEANIETARSGQPFNMEYRLIAEDQRVIWVKDEAILVKDERGAPQFWLGVWTDITTRKLAEEEQADLVGVMTRRNIQLQTAAEVSRAASSILDLNTLLPAVVDLICSHFDYYYVGIFLVDESKEWAVLSAATGEAGQRMISAGHRLRIEDSSMIGWSIKNRQARIALDVGEDAVRFKNPHLPLTRSEIALPLITHGNVIGAMTIQSARAAAFSRADITALQTMADQMANAIENARLFTERADLIEELGARNAELEQFTYTVSHDLRSPLVTIRGFLGYLRQDAASGDITRFDKDLGRIASAVDTMASLLNDLLELSRIGRIINPPEIVPFGEIVNDAVELLYGLLEKNNIRMIMQNEFPSVYGDRARLLEAMQNLISNAAKFMGDQPRPTIEIGTVSTASVEAPVFFVRDNGIGIDPQFHEQIFGLFNRLDSTVDGTGIGLTLVKRIIEIHGGRIWVQSEPGAGATFYFTLPVDESQQQNR